MKTDLKLILVALALMLVTAATGKAGAESAAISFDPTKTNELPTGETFTVNVVITDVSNLYGWQMNVTFNPSILTAVKVSEGPFLKNVNKSAWPKPVMNNDEGYVFASAVFNVPFPPAGATGSGILANITFTVKSGGGSTLHFDETLTYLRTVQGDIVVPIEGVTRQDGTYGGGGTTGSIGGVPLELVAGVAVAAVIVVAAGVFFLIRRRGKAEGAIR